MKQNFSTPIAIAPAIEVVAIANDGKSCHLIVSGGSSLLINCVAGLTPSGIESAGYPAPSEIWHTHVDDALSAEGHAFQEARIRLPRPFAEVAADSEGYRKAARATWENPEKWMEDLGRQPYGIAGSLILRPPATPLAGPETFESGGTLFWKGLRFEVWDFSVRDFYAVGFALQIGGKVVALFGGDLVHGDGNLPDAHGFEANYSGPPWGRVAATIKQAALRDPQWLFPSRGEPSAQAAPLLGQLAERVDAFARSLPAPAWEAQVPAALFGRYHDHGNSVFQMAANYGNIILLIDREGNGLMIDPGPCDFENPRREDDFVADLKKFESQAGLKKIDLVLVTHFHGDHFDMWPVVKDRYPGCRLAAWLPVADVLRRPEGYPYACMLSWYGLGWTRCDVDIGMTRQEPLDWHGNPIHTVYLPGHCFVHAGYWMDWEGRRILFSGDSIQSRGTADDLQLLMSNHSVPGTEEGHAAAYRNVIPLGITLNLGGHGSHFENCGALYRASLEKIEQTTARLLGLFGNRTPEEIFVREWLRAAAKNARKLMAVS
ncbi:MAG: MBL fold metallo-hydrolase [Verrucomicrobiota bacterium]